MARRGHPSLVIDSSISKHLEILCGVPLLGLSVVEAIDHRRAVERSLHSSTHSVREGEAGCFQHGRRYVGDVGKLRTDLSLGFDARRPVDHQSVGGSAVMGRDLLVHWN